MKFWRSETKKKANFKRTTPSKSASSDRVSKPAKNFSSLPFFFNYKLGRVLLFLSLFPSFFPKITTFTCISRFCKGLSGVYRQTYPGCRRLFVRGLQFRSSLKRLSSACGRRNETPRRTREKLLLSNGLEISRQLSKTSKYFKSLYFS